MNIHDAIMNPESDVEGTIVVLDIADSTRMKEETEEVGWLGNYAKAFDIIVSQIPETGSVVKYLGDGIMIHFEEDTQTDAINAAIKMQEALEKAKEDNVIKCVCSTGIASGRFKSIPIEDGRFDYIGQVVDRAFRLCSAAMPKAIFADADTVVAANIAKVKSTVGSALRRKPTEYVGSKSEAIQLKGFSKLVDYHPVFWAAEEYGVKPSHSSGARSEPSGHTPSAIAKPEPTVGADRPIIGSHLGRFTEWRGNSGRVRGEDGTEYFCHKGSVAEGFSLNGGEEVFFTVTATDKALDMADSIVPLGSTFEGEVINLRGANAFLKANGFGQLGHDNVYLYVEDGLNVSEGTSGSFYLGKGYSKQKGKHTPRAENFELV